MDSDPEEADALMAYATDIRYKCLCGKWATKAIRNRFNALMMYACTVCAKREVRRLNKEQL